MVFKEGDIVAAKLGTEYGLYFTHALVVVEAERIGGKLRCTHLGGDSSNYYNPYDLQRVVVTPAGPALVGMKPKQYVRFVLLT